HIAAPNGRGDRPGAGPLRRLEDELVRHTRVERTVVRDQPCRIVRVRLHSRDGTASRGERVAPYYRPERADVVSSDVVFAPEEEALEDRDAADKRKRTRVALPERRRIAESAKVIDLETHRHHVRPFGPAS